MKYRLLVDLLSRNNIPKFLSMTKIWQKFGKSTPHHVHEKLWLHVALDTVLTVGGD